MTLRHRSSLIAIVLAAVALAASCGTTTTTTTTPAPVISSINGATSGAAAIGAEFIVEGSNFQSITAATTGYTVDLRDTTTNNIVAQAPVRFGTTGYWTDTAIKASVPGGLTLGTTYYLTVTTPKGTTSHLGFIIVPATSFAPSTALWTQTLSLPAPVNGAATIAPNLAGNSFLFVIGGNTGTPGAADAKTMNVGTVYQAMLNGADGSVQNATWTTATAMPVKRGFAAAVFANPYNSLAGNNTVYVLGGLDETGTAVNTVILASISANGSIPTSGTTGTWSTTTALPQPLYGAAAAIAFGRIYVTGGNDSSGTPVNKVYSALINSDGTVGSWTELTALPVALAYHQLVVSGTQLYVLGGEGAPTDPVSNALGASPQDAIYWNTITITDGTIAAGWSTNATPLPTAREKFSAVSSNGFILISGGLYAGPSAAHEQSLASVNADFTLTAFTDLAAVHSIANTGGYNFYNQGGVMAADASGIVHVYILGGGDVDTGALHSEVWYQH